jgi:hypothetical protein
MQSKIEIDQKSKEVLEKPWFAFFHEKSSKNGNKSILSMLSIQRAWN